jgi:hypothetical protein
MDVFYHAANFFVRHPERAWGIAAAFFAWSFVSLLVNGRAARGIRSWPLLVPAISWTIFGFLELSFEKFDIRIDLFVTWPVVLGITAICGAWWIGAHLVALRRRAKAK